MFLLQRTCACLLLLGCGGHDATTQSAADHEASAEQALSQLNWTEDEEQLWEACCLLAVEAAFGDRDHTNVFPDLAARCREPVRTVLDPSPVEAETAEPTDEMTVDLRIHEPYDRGLPCRPAQYVLVLRVRRGQREWTQRFMGCDNYPGDGDFIECDDRRMTMVTGDDWVEVREADSGTPVVRIDLN